MSPAISTVCNFHDRPALHLPLGHADLMTSVRLKSIATGRVHVEPLAAVQMAGDKAYVLLHSDAFQIGESVAWEQDVTIREQDMEAWFRSDDEVPLAGWKPCADVPAIDPAPIEPDLIIGYEEEQRRRADQQPAPEPEPAEETHTETVTEQESEEPPAQEAPKTAHLSKAEVLGLLRFHKRPMTMREMAVIFNFGYNDTIRQAFAKCLSELEAEGHVRRAGKTDTRGAPAIQWEAVE